MPDGSQEYTCLQVSPAFRHKGSVAGQINLINEFTLYITALTDRQPSHWCRRGWQMFINIGHTLSESSQAPQQEAVMVLTLLSLLFNQFKMIFRLAAYSHRFQV